jgi:hypothetical protein
MSESAVGLSILAGLVLVSSVVSHRFIPNLFLASGFAAAAAAIAFQVVAYWHAGFLDPFFPIALAISFVCAFVSSLLIGYSMRRFGLVRRPTLR